MNGWSGIWRELFVPETGMGPGFVPQVTDLLNAFLPILLVAFLVTLGTVPICRWLAIRYGVIDRPDGVRKVHRIPIAYLGGAAVFAGVLAGIVSSEVLRGLEEARVASGDEGILVHYPPMTYAVVFGMLAIFATGVLDDIVHWDPRLKLAGQLVAAAGLAMTDFGTNAVSGLLAPLVTWAGLGEHLHIGVTVDQSVQIWNWFTDACVVGKGAEFVPFMTLEGVYYWVGLLFIAAMVLGASNAANLIDGLDGLLSGTVGIMAVGFIAIGVMLAVVDARDSVRERAVGIDIARMFVERDWTDAGTVALLDAELIGTRDGKPEILLARDGKVGFDDLQAFVGREDSDGHLRHALPSPELRAELEVLHPGNSSLLDAGSADTWNPSFRGKEKLLAAFDPAKPEFNLVEVAEVLDVIFGNRRVVVDQADLRAWYDRTGILEEARDPLAGARLVIAFALLGACLGFLPYNFNPAVIFLGDAGSLLMGFLCGVLIISLGSEGQTHYVIAGLIVFALPIMDTVLAIIRRKLAGLPLSAPDKNHIHHMAMRSLGSVKKAVFTLYALDLAFVAMGVGLAATVAIGGARYLLVYGVAIVVFGMVGTMATKSALRQRWMLQLTEREGLQNAESDGD